MITEYNVLCPCGFKANVEQGRERKNQIFEVFSCTLCKNLFSVSLEDDVICKKCGNTHLVVYNPNKKENLAFFKKMAAQLTKDKLDELQNYWKTINDCKCPKCGEDTLNWVPNNAAQTSFKTGSKITKKSKTLQKVRSRKG